MTDNYMKIHPDDWRQLLGDIEQLRKERDDAKVDQRLIEELWERRTDATEMQEQIKLLRKERDEARRAVCYAEVNGQYGKKYTPQGISLERGWDCFKETP